MLRSMYAGISGMKGFQTKLDTIGNNIANVNTNGYKKGRVTFQEMMSQTISAAEGPTATRGGINPVQIGLGTEIGSIDNIHTQGNRQTTNRTLDLALEGDGMFALKDGDDTIYTRSGNFYLDADGNVVNSDGYYLADKDNEKINIPTTAESFNILEDGTVRYVDSEDSAPDFQQIGIAVFSNPGGLEKLGSNTFKYTENAGVDPEGTFEVAGANGVATIVSGALEMSNVDLADEFTEMITAQRGFQANTRIITTSDEILQELVNLKR